MKIIVCIDDKNGMMFNHRRQSKDREVRRDMLSYIGQHRLWMNEYSRKQFEAVPKDAQIEVNENFPAFAGDDDYCFIENSIYLLNKNLITEIVIYHWNRIYPSDTTKLCFCKNRMIYNGMLNFFKICHHTFFVNS